MLDDKESAGSDALVSFGVPPFQCLLMEFLDKRAPLLGEFLISSISLSIILLFCSRKLVLRLLLLSFLPPHYLI